MSEFNVRVDSLSSDHVFVREVECHDIESAVKHPKSIEMFYVDFRQLLVYVLDYVYHNVLFRVTQFLASQHWSYRINIPDSRAS